MRISDFATRSLLNVKERMVENTMPINHLYHATSESNLSSIRLNGLQTKFYGDVHGGMEIHPPKPAIYLSRKPKSDNLHTELANRGKIVVLQINAIGLDPNEFYPDDLLYDLVAEGEILSSARNIAQALRCDAAKAMKIFNQIEQADAESLPIILKPFWKWYLQWKNGGEVAYTANIPPELIVNVRPF